MVKLARIAIVILALMVVASSQIAFCDRINPYLPMNAVPAMPEPPYDPEISRIGFYYYPPCPGCIPFGKLVPDIPPVWKPERGPFGIPVTVP